MPPLTNSRIPLIQTWSRRLGWVMTGILIVLPVLVIVVLACSWRFGLEIEAGGVEPVNLALMQPLEILRVVLRTFLEFALYVVPMLYLRQLLNFWAQGDILTRDAARAIRLSGMALFAVSVVSGFVLPLVEMAYNAALGLSAEPSFSLDLTSLVAAGIIYVVGLVLEEAARVAEDAELTI